MRVPKIFVAFAVSCCAFQAYSMEKDSKDYDFKKDKERACITLVADDQTADQFKPELFFSSHALVSLIKHLLPGIIEQEHGKTVEQIESLAQLFQSREDYQEAFLRLLKIFKERSSFCQAITKAIDNVLYDEKSSAYKITAGKIGRSRLKTSEQLKIFKEVLSFIHRAQEESLVNHRELASSLEIVLDKTSLSDTDCSDLFVYADAFNIPPLLVALAQVSNKKLTKLDLPPVLRGRTYRERAYVGQHKGSDLTGFVFLLGEDCFLPHGAPLDDGLKKELMKAKEPSAVFAFATLWEKYFKNIAEQERKKLIQQLPFSRAKVYLAAVDPAINFKLFFGGAPREALAMLDGIAHDLVRFAWGMYIGRDDQSFLNKLSDIFYTILDGPFKFKIRRFYQAHCDEIKTIIDEGEESEVYRARPMGYMRAKKYMLEHDLDSEPEGKSLDILTYGASTSFNLSHGWTKDTPESERRGDQNLVYLATHNLGDKIGKCLKAMTIFDKNASKDGHILYLDLSGTKISTLSDSIGDLKHLKGLALSNNKLSELPEGIKNLINLERLDVSGNKELDQNQLRAVILKLLENKGIKLKKEDYDLGLEELCLKGGITLIR